MTDKHDRSRAKHPDHVRARDAVQYAISKGRLVRAATLSCEDCGVPASQYDHYLGYSPIHRLDVQAVCTRCHGIRGRREYCPRGHSMDDAIVYPGTGKRACRQCAAKSPAHIRIRGDGSYDRKPLEQRHGTRYAYVKYGCRCALCVEANSDYFRTRRLVLAGTV